MNRVRELYWLGLAWLWARDLAKRPGFYAHEPILRGALVEINKRVHRADQRAPMTKPIPDLPRFYV